MATTQLLTFLATIVVSGWLAAFLVQAVKREKWPSSAKLVLAIILSAVVGVATAWLTGSVTTLITLWHHGTLTAAELLTFGAAVFAAAQTWYHIYWSHQTWAASLAAWPTRRTPAPPA